MNIYVKMNSKKANKKIIRRNNVTMYKYINLIAIAFTVKNHKSIRFSIYIH